MNSHGGLGILADFMKFYDKYLEDEVVMEWVKKYYSHIRNSRNSSVETKQLDLEDAIIKSKNGAY